MLNVTEQLYILSPLHRLLNQTTPEPEPLCGFLVVGTLTESLPAAFSTVLRHGLWKVEAARCRLKASAENKGLSFPLFLGVDFFIEFLGTFHNFIVVFVGNSLFHPLISLLLFLVRLKLVAKDQKIQRTHSILVLRAERSVTE